MALMSYQPLPLLLLQHGSNAMQQKFHLMVATCSCGQGVVTLEVHGCQHWQVVHLCTLGTEGMCKLHAPMSV